MRCPTIALCVLFSISFLPPNLSAQTRQDALRAMQALQTQCEGGINFDGYAAALDDAQIKLREFFDSKECDRNPDFADRIERALIAYQSAFVLWQGKVDYKQDFVSADHPTMRMLLDVYPDAGSLFGRDGQAQVRGLVTFLWDKGDARLNEAKRMISGKGRR